MQSKANLKKDLGSIQGTKFIYWHIYGNFCVLNNPCKKHTVDIFYGAHATGNKEGIAIFSSLICNFSRFNDTKKILVCLAVLIYYGLTYQHLKMIIAEIHY